MSEYSYQQPDVLKNIPHILIIKVQISAHILDKGINKLINGADNRQISVVYTEKFL